MYNNPIKENQEKITNNSKIAIVHDYFNQNGGAENVIESLLKLYPKADIYTSVFIPQHFVNSPILTEVYNSGRIKTTLLDKIFMKNGQKTNNLKYFKHIYFLYPIFMSFLEIKNYDLVIVTSTYCAKNVKLNNNKKILHYIHSPARFLHGLLTEKDHSALPVWQKVISTVIKPPLKWLDLNGVANLVRQNTYWVSNSHFVRSMVKKAYKIDSDVIFPPVNLTKYNKITKEESLIEEYYICHGRISFHKRIDLAIEACLVLNKKLYISGTSALEIDFENLKKLVPESKKDLIVFLGRTTDEQLEGLISKAKAMIFPGKEDAGIAPIECLAAGLPVIAYQAGGALEYVKDGINGIFFEKQEIDCLVEAILEFELTKFDIQIIKDSVVEFSEESFANKIIDTIDRI